MLQLQLLHAAAGKLPRVRVQLFALGTVLREGLVKLDTQRFQQQPVPVAAAQQQLERRLQEQPDGAALLACLREQYGSSLLEVLREPECRELTEILAVGEQQQVLLRIDRLQQYSHTGAPAASYGSMPAPSDASMAAASSSAATAAPIARPAAPRPAARVGTMPAPQLVTTEQAAAAAVDRLLAVNEVAMDCEGALERSGSISLIQLYAPGSASGSSDSAAASSSGGGCCYVFDLHAMQPHVRQAAMRHLARLLESGSTTKVRAWELLCTALCPTAMHALQRPAGPRHLPHTSNSHHCAICPTQRSCCRCCTTAAATARRSSICTGSAAPASGTHRQAGGWLPGVAQILL